MANRRTYAREWYRKRAGIAPRSSCCFCHGPMPEGCRTTTKYCSRYCGNAARQLAYANRHLEKIMVIHARARARKTGAPFDLTPDDIQIPTHCPVLGIPLQRGRGSGLHPNSPSLDRLVPEAGYVRGNVRVISARANHLKSNATIAEIEAVLADLRRIYAPRGV